MRYPTEQQVKDADRMDVCRWYRFLPIAENETEAKIEKLVYDKFKELGGFTPEISKAVGW